MADESSMLMEFTYGEVTLTLYINPELTIANVLQLINSGYMWKWQNLAVNKVVFDRIRPNPGDRPYFATMDTLLQDLRRPSTPQFELIVQVFLIQFTYSDAVGNSNHTVDVALSLDDTMQDALDKINGRSLPFWAGRSFRSVQRSSNSAYDLDTTIGEVLGSPEDIEMQPTPVFTLGL